MEKRSKKPGYRAIVLGALIIHLSTVAVSAIDISLVDAKSVEMDQADRLTCGCPVTFYLRLKNELPWSIGLLSNGFQLYSPNGASWRPSIYVDTIIDIFPPPATTTLDTSWYGRFLPLSIPNLSWTIVYGSHIMPIFDLGISVEVVSGDGLLSDTVRFAGQTGTNGLGIGSGFDQIAWSISLDSVSCPEMGEWFTLCIDSVHRIAMPSWIWAGLQPAQEYSPSWGGPYCFEVHGDFDGDSFADDLDNCPAVHNPGQEDRDNDGIGDACSSCCVGIRGNCDGDPSDLIDIVDLTFVVAYMFKDGDPPSCIEEANVNGLPAEADILDLTYLIEYMFKGGPAPVMCTPQY